MPWTNEENKYSDALIARINRLAEKIPQEEIRLMEICGTHTMSIFQHGLRSLLPMKISLLSGPGCPVCVTTPEVVEQAVVLSLEPDTVVATFGDMLRVKGSRGRTLREAGGNVKIIYSPLDALRMAQEDPKKKIVLFGVGFETTAAPFAVTLWEARKAEVGNLLFLPSLKRVIPVMHALLDEGESRLDGFLCPGHVSTIIGSDAFKGIAEKYRKPCVVAGFSGVEILEAVLCCLQQMEQGESRVENAYSRAVTAEGNLLALEMMERVFAVADEKFRGFGLIKEGGFRLREEFAHFAVPEAEDIPEAKEACSCGEVLRGMKIPLQCPNFGKRCTPSDPVGPCMVSHEGTCGIYYRYQGGQR